MGNAFLNKSFDSQAFVGCRVQLKYTNDQFTFLEPGTTGTIDFIDDFGTLHVKWDNGSRLGLIPGIDKYLLLSEGIDDH